MNVLAFGDLCCGCGTCCVVCPVQAISMECNNKGFYHPVVDNQKCVNCLQCVRYCAFSNTDKKQTRNSLLGAFALKHADSDVRAASRSGGVFTALSDRVLDMDGVVYGCKLINNREAVHIRATSKEERDQFRGSKYIQSKMFDVFEAIKTDLNQGRWVLFSGTGCQVDAVASYCRNLNCDKLLLLDIVCHGVPSSRVWSDYLDYLEEKHGKKIVSVDFRDKKNFGWNAHKETVVFEDDSSYSGNIFTKLFYSHNIIRKCCFDCPYKNLHRVGDISIADCWGVAQHYAEFDDDKGVSLVMVNTEKGKQFFEQLSDTEYIEVEINKLLQPPLKENWPVPVEYDRFWRYYRRHPFEKTVKQFVLGQESLARRAVRKVYYSIRRSCGRLLRK